VGSIPNPEEGHETWITKFLHGEGKHDFGTQYVYAVYFTLTTMTTVGYGDMSPQNETEVHFVLFLLLVASVVFAGLMGALTDLVFNLNSEGNLRAERKAMLSRYMRWRAVPRVLFTSVREHLLFLWETNDCFDEYEEQIKEQLSPVLKKELCFHIYGRILNAAPFLAWMRGCEISQKDLAQVVVSMFLSQGDYLFHVGQPNEHIYVFLKGTIYISQNEKLSLAPSHKDTAESGGATDFAIPRNKEANVVDVIKMTMSSMTETVSKKKLDASKYAAHWSLAVEEKKQERILGMLGPSLKDMKEEDAVEAADKSPKIPMLTRSASLDTIEGKKDESQDLLEAHVDSAVLHSAFKKLHRLDVREKQAARLVQRLWRHKVHVRIHGTVLEPKGNVKRLSSAPSKFVHAPAYLGESCLWEPLEDWDGPAKTYPYAARCETRGEFVYIARRDVKDIIDRFSPWLQARFDYFREAVVENIEKAELGEEFSPHINPAPEQTVSAPAAGRAAMPAASSNEDPRPTRPHDMVFRSTQEGDGARCAGPYPESSRCSYSSTPATPLCVAMQQRQARRTGGGGTARSFRAAAAAAIARVTVHVTPPSELPTPRAARTPRAATPRGATPRAHAPGDSVPYVSSRGPVTEPLAEAASSSSDSLRQPLLQAAPTGGQ